MAALGSLLLLLQLCVCSYTLSPIQTKSACNGETLHIICSESNTPYIHVSRVLYGFPKLTVSPLTENTTCPDWNTADCFEMPGDSSIMGDCHGNTTCHIERINAVKAEYPCNDTAYNNTSAYLLVQFTCEKTMPTTTSAPITTTTAPTTTTTVPATTRWAPPTTTEYVNFLSTGAQAGIIVAIMVGLTIIFAAITVYKCVKYGPSDDTRKFFSKAPEPGAIDDPKIIPWVPGEAQEEIYRNITEKAKAKSKKKRKFKF